MLSNRSEAAEAKRNEPQLATLAEGEVGSLQKVELDHVRQRNEERASGKERAAKREMRQKVVAAASMTLPELKLALKDMFNERDFWSRRDLELKLGNKDKLGQCLEELCIKVTARSSAHYSDWQLKPELRSGLKKKAE